MDFVATVFFGFATLAGVFLLGTVVIPYLVLGRLRRACLREERMTLPLPPDAAFEHCAARLAWLDPSGLLQRSDATERTMEANVGSTLWSFGERVRLELTPAKEGTEVRVMSWCRVPTTLVDWGKNAANLKRVINGLSSATAPAAAPAVVARRHPAEASTRCPYCRDAVEIEDGVACTACAARHHEGCWDEHLQCAACGHTERYGKIERTAGRTPPARRSEK